MQKWEYMFLDVEGHNKFLSQADNMVVTTSDGKWQGTKMPKNIMGVLNQLGLEGWEMINCTGSSEWGSLTRFSSFGAVFKRSKE